MRVGGSSVSLLTDYAQVDMDSFRCQFVNFGRDGAIGGSNLIGTSMYDKYSGSANITTHLDQISRCQTAYGRIDGPGEYLP